MLILLGLLFSLCSFSSDETPPFERQVESKNITVVCVGDVSDHLIFSLKFKEGELTHDFLLMRGLDFETCIDLRARIKKILKHNPKVLLAGHTGSPLGLKNQLFYDWKYIKGKNSCVSYVIDYCPK